MRFGPSRDSFYDLFEKHVDTVLMMCQELKELLTHYDRLSERQGRIKDLEHRCDQLTHEIAIKLHTHLILPLDAEDIAATASGLDDIADYVDAAAVRFELYRIEESTPEARALADLLVSTVTVLQEAVPLLRHHQEHERLLTLCREVKRLEGAADNVYRHALGLLFNAPGADPILVMKWQEIYQRLEQAVDKCDDVANVLEGVKFKDR
jgi:uncharacterized protein